MGDIIGFGVAAFFVILGAGMAVLGFYEITAVQNKSKLVSRPFKMGIWDGLATF